MGSGAGWRDDVCWNWCVCVSGTRAHGSISVRPEGAGGGGHELPPEQVPLSTMHFGEHMRGLLSGAEASSNLMSFGVERPPGTC